MIVIPNLRETPFHRLDVSLSVSVDHNANDEDFSPTDCALTAQISADRPIFVTLEMGQEIGETEEFVAWLTLAFDKPPAKPERARFAEEPGVQERFPCSKDKWERSNPDAIWNELGVFLSRTVAIRVDASYSTGRDDIPPDSLVASMIGLRTKAGEEQYLMSGAQFSIHGFPDDTISWYLKPGSHGGTIAGNVTRKCVGNFNPESVSDIVHVLEGRFNRIVLAHSDISAHATS
jgi:hypothetical protein